MSKILITYGSNEFEKSLKRIHKEATNLGFFDKVILYTEKDLPIYIKSLPAFAFKRGGGYWIWKPFIINKTLAECSENDIIVYVDSGCVLQKSFQWDEYFELLKSYNGIFFQYKDIDYGWGAFSKNNSPKLKYWIKKNAIDYFNNYFNNSEWLNYNKIMGGVILLKKNKENNILEDWYRLSLFYPELFVDVSNLQKESENPNLNEHRHDQALLSALVFYFNKKDNVLIMPERSELENSGAILTKRNKEAVMGFYEKIIHKLKTFKNIWFSI